MPDSTEEQGIVEHGDFSPDGEYFAHVFRPSKPNTPWAVFVFNTTTGESSPVYTAPCTEYIGISGRVCGSIGGLTWIDNDHLVIHHTGSMPSTLKGTTIADEDTLTIKTVDGNTVHSYHTPMSMVGAVGSAVIINDGGSRKWVDVSDFLNGNLNMHSLPPLKEHTTRFSYSPDSQYELAHVLGPDYPWELVEVRTGTSRRLGMTTRAIDRIDYCAWSPDQSSVACEGVEREKFGGCRFFVMLIVPLSETPEKILIRSEQPVWDKWGHLLVWQL